MIRRTLSIPVFVLSVLGIAGAASGFHFVRQWQLSRLSQLLLAQAEKAEMGEKWREAVEHLDRYVRLLPQHKGARTRLAVAFAKSAETLEEKQRAVEIHRRALASGSGDQEETLRCNLAELLLETDRLLEAEREATTILQHHPGQHRASRVYALSRHFQWRRGALSSKRPAELRLLPVIEDALQKNPRDIALSEIAATLYRDFPEIVAAHRAGLNQQDRARIADGFLDSLVRGQPDNAKVYLSRHVYRAKYKLRGSQGDLEEALKLAPDDWKVVLVAAEAYFGQAAQALTGAASDTPSETPLTRDEALKLLEMSEALFRRLIDKELLKGTADPQLRLGDIRVLQGKLDEAIAIWQAAAIELKRPTDQVACHARIADNLLPAGRVSESQSAIEEIEGILATLAGTITRQEHLTLLQAQGLRRATYFVHRGRYSDTIAEVQQAIARQPQLQPDPKTSHFAWDLLGRGFAGLEDWTEAATAFDRASNFQTSAAGSRLAAARSWLMAGRNDLAIDRAEQVILVEESPEAWIILATAELQTQASAAPLDRSWTRVQSALQRLDQLDPAAIDAPWRIDFLKADYIALRTPTEAEAAYGNAAAAEVLRLAEAKYENGNQFWFEACLAYERLGQPQDAERAWQHLNQLPGAQTESVIAAARRAAMHEDFVRAHRILDEASAATPMADRGRLRKESIRVAQARQNLPQMKTLLEEELKERPRDVGVLCQLAELDLREKNLAALRGWEEKLQDAGYLGDLWARYFRVIRLYSTASGPRDGVLKEALAEQAQLATLRPNWPESYALRGMIEQRMERMEAAVTAYEQAIALGERRYAIFEQLIACLDRLHRHADVERYLARLESFLPSSQSLTEIATHRQLENDRPERAVEIARRSLEERPDDLRAQLWLGRLLLMTNQHSEAREVFAKATETSPQDVRSWNGLFTFYLRIGDRDQARKVLESLRQNAKLDPVELDLVLGQAHMQLGESAEAMRLLSSLSQQAPNRADVHVQLARLYLETDREKSKEYLEKAIQIDPKLAQARYLLAAILAAGGSEAELAQAEQLLGGASDSGAAATIEDRRVRALLLAQHGGASGVDRAIRIMEQIVQEGGESTSDRLLLAQFYERQSGTTPDADEAATRLKLARDQFVAVASRSRSQVADVAALIAFFLRHDQAAEAGVWLDRLEERVRTQSRNDPRAIALLIELRLKHGTFAQCESWITQLESIDLDPVRPLAARVKWMMARGENDRIESLIEEKAKAALELIKDGKVRGRIARAIGDLYVVANMLIGAERWYRIVVQEDKDQFPVLALTLVRQGRVREAIRLCQSAAEHDASSRPAIVLASILLEAGGKAEHTEIAEPMLAAALKKFPQEVDLLYCMGMLRVLGDRYQEATELLQKVIALHPRHGAALNNLACILAETPDRREEAAQLVEQAINLRGQEPTLLDTQGAILVVGGRSSEAVGLLEAAARGTHSDPRHKFHLAIAYQDIGNEEKAREQLETALAQSLDKQILTPSDRKLLARLQSTLKIPTP